MLPRRHGEAAGATLRARSRRPHGPEKRVWRDQDLRQQSPSRWLPECGVTAAAYPTAFDAGRSGRPHHHLGFVEAVDGFGEGIDAPMSVKQLLTPAAAACKAG